MLVALSILIILMAAVGEIFSLAGRTVRVGQATLTAMSSIRAVESQIARDVKHLDQNGFLIIRQRYYAPYWQPGVQYEPGDEVEYSPNGTVGFYLCQQVNTTQAGVAGVPSIPSPTNGGTSDWQLLSTTPGLTYPIWRADEITFMETGDFHSRSGSGTGASATMAGYLTSNKAIVWFGQFSASYGAAGYNFPTAFSTTAPTSVTTSPNLQEAEKPYWPQNAWIPLGMPPSGETSGQFYFGREAMLLIPSGGNAFGSDVYTDPFYDAASTTSGKPGASVSDPYSGTLSDGAAAVATSSRLDATYDAVPGVVGTIEGYVSSLPLASPYTNLSYIANYFGYRYSTLPTPGASEVNPNTTSQALNGYYRMTPIMLQGVPSFAVDWTDGAQNGSAAPYQLDWYGMDGNTGTGSVPVSAGGPAFPNAFAAFPNAIAVAGNSGDGDVQFGATTDKNTTPTYVFYAGNKPYWPKALKITYCVTDPNNRLQGGRWITQVVNLPQ